MYLQNKNRLTDIENKFIVTKRKKVEKDKLKGWDQQIQVQTIIHKRDKQEGPTVQHINSISCTTT